MDKKRSEIFLPNEVLIQTFSYLEMADVRSCRLVCRQWYFCCGDKMITRAEKFVFRSDINLTAEINEFLINLQRGKVNVELFKIDLRELNFELFGSKIEELELKECIIDVDTFKNLFYATPNMTRFCLSTRMIVVAPYWWHDLDLIRSDVEVWARGVNLLHEEKFQNVNMIEFIWNHDVEKELMDDLGCSLSDFLFIFPRLRSIYLWKSFMSDVIPELRDLFPTTNITCLGGTFDMDLDMIDHSETFASFSRLKRLDLNIHVFSWNRSSLSACDRLFSQMAELEELTCQFCNSEEESRGELSKTVLFQILKSCLKLTKLSFSTSFTNRHIYLNRDEMWEFSSLIKKIKNIQLSTIMTVESDIREPIVPRSNTDGRPKDLDFDLFYEPSNVGYRIMETDQLTTLSLTNDPERFCLNFEKILQSQKCLQRLEITISSTKDFSKSKWDMNLKEVIPLKHERLNHLVYSFDEYGGNLSKYHFGRLFMCELPNLRTLRLDAGMDDSEDEDSEDDNSEFHDSEDNSSDVYDSEVHDSEDDDSEVHDSDDNDSEDDDSEVENSEDDDSEVDDSEDNGSEVHNSDDNDSEDNDSDDDSEDNDSDVHNSEVDNSEDDDSEDDDSEVDDSEDDDSEEDDSEVDDSEDDDSEEDDSEVDDSEDDDSEEDDSEVDDSEDNNSEVDDSEDNDSEVDDNEVHNSDDNDSKVHDSEVHNSEDDDSDSGLKNAFNKWLRKMTTLTQIDLKLPRDLLNFEESLKNFGEMRYLQKIVWTSTDPCRYDPSQEMKNLFVHLPNLKSFHYSDEDFHETKGWIYKYHRSKQQLFQQIVINGDTIKNSYNLVL